MNKSNTSEEVRQTQLPARLPGIEMNYDMVRGEMNHGDNVVREDTNQDEIEKYNRRTRRRTDGWDRSMLFL